MTDLHDAIRILTEWHDTPVHDHDGTLIGHRQQEALLVKLSRARVSNINRNSGAAQKHARSPLNTQAVELYTAIDRRIRQWARTANCTHCTGTPTDLLTQWHAHVYLDIDERPYLATLRGWIHAINDLLDPPHRFDIDQPCPQCGAHIIETEVDGEHVRTRALTGLERDPDIHQIQCRNCGATWNGLLQAQQLKAAINLAGAIPA